MPYADGLDVAISRFNGRTQQSNQPWSWGTIASYDQATHTARVVLEPAGHLTGPLRLPTRDTAHCLPPPVGMQCIVALNAGVEEAIIGLYHSTADAPPDTPGMSLPSLYVGGAATVGGLALLPELALPTASASWRGTLLLLAPTPQGVAGAADGLYACLQAAGGTYSWKLVIAG